MKRSFPGLLVAWIAASVVAPNITFADPPQAGGISFGKRVLPVLQSRCMSCHSGANPAAGYAMDSKDKLFAGGRHGAAILPGKSAQGTLVGYLTGVLKPQMPPDGAIDLEKISMIKRWIDEGARMDAPVVLGKAPVRSATALPPSISSKSLPVQAAPVTAIAISPDGKLLAIGGYTAVRLMDITSGALVSTLRAVGASQVQALAWNPDGSSIAIGGGIPGHTGELVIVDLATGKVGVRMVGHDEVVDAISWRPDGTELASGSLDKTVRIWNAATGTCTRTIKDHADTVFGVAYSPDGKTLATASGDRSSKLFETTGWKRIGSLTAHQDAVTHVAFNNNGTLLATSGADKQVRVWKFEPGKMENPLRSLGEGETINCCVFSRDGSLLAWGASNHAVKVFNGDGGNQKREYKDADDWVYTIAIEADNKTVIAGTQTGRLYFWDTGNGKLIKVVEVLPSGLHPVTEAAK